MLEVELVTIKRLELPYMKTLMGAYRIFTANVRVSVKSILGPFFHTKATLHCAIMRSHKRQSKHQLMFCGEVAFTGRVVGIDVMGGRNEAN